MNGDWRELNLANWESRVPVHTGPGGYDLAAFDDAAHLSHGGALRPWGRQ